MDDVLSDMNTILEVKANMMGRIDAVKIRSVLEKVQKALGQDIIDSGAALQVNIGVEDICGNRMYLESIPVQLVEQFDQIPLCQKTLADWPRCPKRKWAGNHGSIRQRGGH
jgi:hypothetical protein